jgi:formylglycine-generating enzyme required for sulfatase activity
MRKTKPRNLLRWCVGLFLTFAFIVMGTSDIAAKIGLDLEWRPIEGVGQPPFKEEKPDEKTGDTQKPGKAGETRSFTVNGVSFKMVRIPAGEFMMGSSLSPEEVERRYGGKAEWYKGEHPQHRVRISRAFWMGQTEVTQGLWKAVMGSNPSHFSNCGDDCPVEKVSWDDCQDFIRKLNGMVSGGNFRLPTEAEWEYACRAGTTGLYAGDLDAMGWYGNNSGNKPIDALAIWNELKDWGKYGQRILDNGCRTHSVATRQPNAWGLYDMHGNVWEWCQDWYSDYPSGSVTDSTGPSSGSFRVLRGGCWDVIAGRCRSALRYGSVPGSRRYALAFRLALP